MLAGNIQILWEFLPAEAECVGAGVQSYLCQKAVVVVTIDLNRFIKFTIGQSPLSLSSNSNEASAEPSKPAETFAGFNSSYFSEQLNFT